MSYWLLFTGDSPKGILPAPVPLTYMANRITSLAKCNYMKHFKWDGGEEHNSEYH